MKSLIFLKITIKIPATNISQIIFCNACCFFSTWYFNVIIAWFEFNYSTASYNIILDKPINPAH